MPLNTLRRKTPLVEGKTSTGASASIDRPRGALVFQVSGKTTAGAGSVTAKLQGSNDKSKVAWNDVASITLTLATALASQELVIKQAAAYRFYRSNVTAISGTGAQANSYIGVA